MRRIATINNKGGVGKTSSCVTLAAETAKLGNRVLVIDLDPQGDASKMFQRYQNTDYTVIDLFMLKGKDVNNESVKKCISKTEYPSIDIIPCNEDFALTVDQIFVDTSRQQQGILRKALRTVEEEYDYVFIDTSTYFNLLTINVLAYCDDVITPVENDGFSFGGLMKLLDRIDQVKEEFNPNLNILGVFFTKVDTSTTLFKEMMENYKEELHQIFIPAYIRMNNKIKETTTVFEPLTFYDANASVTTDYKVLLKQIHILEEPSQKKLERELNRIVRDLEKKNREDTFKIQELKKIEPNSPKIKKLQSNIRNREKEIAKINN